jgi:hypothetical protein
MLLWLDETCDYEGKGNHIINNFKSFFNSIFVNGIENMNKKMGFFHENGTR